MKHPLTFGAFLSRESVRGSNWRHGVAFGVLVCAGMLAAFADVSSPLATLLWLGVASGAALVSPPATLAATLAGLPWIYHPLSLSGGRYSAVDLGAVLGALSLGLRWVVMLVRGQLRAAVVRLISPLGMTWPAAALLLVATLSLATVAEPARRSESLREYRTVIVEPLAIFALCRWCLWQDGVKRWVALAMAVVGAGVAMMALGEIFLRTDVLVADGALRARATYPHPNNLALYLERVGVFAVGWAASALATGDRRGWVPGALGALALAGTIATFSRGALLGVAIGLAVVVGVVGSRRAWIILGSLIGGVALLVLALARSRLLATGSDGEESTRLLIWRASLRMLRDHPVFGVGLDQFLYQYWRRYVEPAGWPERYTSHPHNLLLDVWLRLGILGVAVASWLGGAVACLVRRAGVLRVPRGDAAVGAVAALSAGLAHGLVDNAFFLPDLAVMTWFFVALIEADAAQQTIS